MNFLNVDESNEFDTLNKKSIKHSSSIVMSKASNESYGISCQHILSLTEINKMGTSLNTLNNPDDLPIENYRLLEQA
ncbi:2159_t:CDS:2, partial [Entrophospora sp. SA101]